MLEYGNIDISEGIDIKETNASKECNIFHYWYFKDIGFKYEPYLCNVCHGLMQKAISFNVAIVFVKGNAYRIHFCYMSKDDAINIMNNSSLIHKIEFFWIFFIIYKKMSGIAYYQRNKDVLLNIAQYYYENNKKILRDKGKDNYINLSEEEKTKRVNLEKIDIIICLRKRNKNLKEYQKNYREAK